MPKTADCIHPKLDGQTDLL